MKGIVNIQALFAFCMILFGCALFTGCPGNTTPADGGTIADNANPPGDQAPPKDGTKGVTCSKGAACIQVGSDKVRSCDLLLSHPKAFTAPKVGFGGKVLGYARHKGAKLGMAFRLQKNEALGSESAAAIEIAGDLASLKIDSATCYDAKGVKIDKPDVTVRRP